MFFDRSRPGTVSTVYYAREETEKIECGQCKKVRLSSATRW